MKIVRRYILAEFFKIFMMILTGLTLVYMIVDIFENLGDFTKTQTPILTTVTFFLLHIPQAIYYIFPLSLLFASFLNIALFTKYNEIIAMRSAGLGVLAITSPMLIITFLTSFAIFFMNEYVVPAANSHSQNIKRKIDKRPEEMFFKEDSLWLKSGDRTLFNIRIIDPDRQMMWQVHVYNLSNDFNIIESLSANVAIYEDDQWVMQSGTRRIYNNKNNSLKVDSFKRLPFAFPFELQELSHTAIHASETSFSVLQDYINKIRQEGYEVKRLAVDLYAKTSFPFAGFIMTILGLSLALYTRRLGGIGAGIGFCILISMLYWVCFSLSLHMGYSGLLPAILSAWITNIIFIIVGVYIYYRIALL